MFRLFILYFYGSKNNLRPIDELRNFKLMIWSFTQGFRIHKFTG